MIGNVAVYVRRRDPGAGCVHAGDGVHHAVHSASAGRVLRAPLRPLLRAGSTERRHVGRARGPRDDVRRCGTDVGRAARDSLLYLPEVMSPATAERIRRSPDSFFARTLCEEMRWI